MSYTRDRKFTAKDIEDKVCNMYQNNVFICDIANILHIERHTVVRILKRRNLYDLSKSKVHLNNTKIARNQEIMKLSRQGLSIRQIASALNISKSSVQYILSKFHYDLIPTNINMSHFQKHIYDTHFFANIDTEEKAYWLGFLYADGCVTGKGLRCELQLKDRIHLEKLRDALKYFTVKFYFRNDIQSITLVVNSVLMAQDLMKKGCMPCKSLKIRFPSTDIVPTCLIHHFMRGYFDGDGCINIHDTLRASVSITSNLEFLTEYQKVLNVGIGKDTTVKIYPHWKTLGLGFFMLGGNRQVKKIYDFLYKNATVYLDRKKEKFNILISRLNAKDTAEALRL